MASKRLRKKQQTKQNIKMLETIGIKDKSQIKQLKNKPQQVQKIYKKETRKTTANYRSSLLKQLGYKVSEHSSKRYWSESRWNDWYKKELNKIEKQKRKLLEDNELYLLMFWQDKTSDGYSDEEMIERFKFQYRFLDNSGLIERIRFFVTTQDTVPAEIGKSLTMVLTAKDRKKYINFMTKISDFSSSERDKNDWILVYEGKAQRYHPLLLAIHAMVRLMYDAGDRGKFISKLIDKDLRQINPNMARRLAKDIGWRDF